MTIAIPTTDGRLHEHFGGATQFTLVQADPVQRKVLGIRTLAAPPHAPGVFPRWLREQGANVVIAGGIGRRALDLFAEEGILVRTGTAAAPAEELASAFLEGRLTATPQGCEHHGHHHNHQGRQHHHHGPGHADEKRAGAE